VLSIEQCRKVLGPACELTDSALESFRDQLYGLADIGIDLFLGLPRDRQAHLQRVGKMTDKEQEAWEERAAIMEFDGGLTRAEAESRALNIVCNEKGKRL